MAMAAFRAGDAVKIAIWLNFSVLKEVKPGYRVKGISALLCAHFSELEKIFDKKLPGSRIFLTEEK